MRTDSFFMNMKTLKPFVMALLTGMLGTALYNKAKTQSWGHVLP